MHIDLAIVEDNPGDVELIRALLSADSLGSFNIRHVPRISDLIALYASTRPPDVLLLDLNLPDSHGFATIDQVRHDLPHVPVVAMTSSAEDQMALDAAEAGVQDFIIKGDFDGPGLAQTLHFAITRQRCTNVLFKRANFDQLTGLANRFLFQDRLTHALQRANRTDETVALLFIDLDDFKAINDAYGRDVGDDFLQALAQAFVANVRDCDTVAHLGGDEFAVIVEGLSYPQAAIDVARKLLTIAEQPIELEQHTIQGSFSIGIAFHTEDKAKGQHWLIKGADMALSTAKSSGKNDFRTYTDELDRDLVACIHQDSMLQEALAKNEFLLHCQPIVDTRTKRLLAYETLIRWQPHDRRPLLPGTFISSLERLGLMREVGEFILHRAIGQHVEWMRDGMSPVSVCVNVSASQIADPGFSRLVRSVVNEYGLPPQHLSLELTEDLLINNTPDTRRMFAELSEFGVKFSIDDFGTGHNSYSYLKNFPISTIKIDRSFTRLLHVDRIDRAIARSLITLARELDLQVIAEGVENHIVQTELEGLEPDGLQGFLIGRPMPAERFERRFVQPVATPGKTVLTA
jgi:diguanylate cyclase (GGDEF)-like protein